MARFTCAETGSKGKAVIAWIFIYLVLWAAVAALNARFLYLFGGCGTCGSKSYALKGKAGRGGAVADLGSGGNYS